MRVLLRKVETGKYYSGDHTWTSAASRAHDFQHAEEAIQFAQVHHWVGVELVLTYDNTGTEVALPLQPKERAKGPGDGFVSEA